MQGVNRLGIMRFVTEINVSQSILAFIACYLIFSQEYSSVLSRPTFFLPHTKGVLILRLKFMILALRDPSLLSTNVSNADNKYLSDSKSSYHESM